jgi:hypothetical protein
VIHALLGMSLVAKDTLTVRRHMLLIVVALVATVGAQVATIGAQVATMVALAGCVCAFVLRLRLLVLTNEWLERRGAHNHRN